MNTHTLSLTTHTLSHLSLSSISLISLSLSLSLSLSQRVSVLDVLFVACTVFANSKIKLFFKDDSQTATVNFKNKL